jgi:hypothetical protein
MSEQKKYYVYVLARPDGRPFYVGKGTRYRIAFHEWEARMGHKCHKCNVIRKIWKNGGAVRRFIILQTADEQEALSYEQDLIAFYGRDYLTNLTSGGEGTGGYTWTDERREIQGKKSRAMWRNPEYRQHMKRIHAGSAYKVRQSESQRRAWANPQHRANRVAGIRRAWESSEAHDLRRYNSKALWQRDDYRQKHRESMKEALSRPETKAKLSSANRKKWANPEYRAKIVTKLKGQPKSREAITNLRKTLSTPEAKAQRSEALKRRWNDPEERAKLLAARVAKRAAREQQ